MVLPLALFFVVLTFLLLLYSPRIGLLVAVFSKPIIDLSWQHPVVLGFSTLDIIGVGLPTIILLRMMLLPRERPERMLYMGVWLFYIFANLMGLSVILSTGRVETTASMFFRILNGVAAFYMFQVYFSEREDFRKLLLAFLFAGLTPMLMGLYESLTGHYLRERLGTEGQMRITGLYHNSAVYRHYSYQTLTAILLFWSYFLGRNIILKAIFTAYISTCLVVLYKIFSKAGFATLGVGTIIWTFVKRRFGILLLLAAAAGVLNFATGNVFLEEILRTYSREIAVIEGTGDIDRMFAGRVAGWKSLLRQFSESPAFDQLFGWGEVAGGHNDFIRALVTTGIVGLMAYIVLLVTIGYGLLQRFFHHRNDLITMALIIYGAWMADAIGRSPSMFISFQWYSWGFIGLALYGVRGVTKETRPREEPSVEVRSPRLLRSARHNNDDL